MQLFNFPPSDCINRIRCEFNEKTQQFEFYLVDDKGDRQVAMGGDLSLPFDNSERARDHMAHSILYRCLEFYRAGYNAAKRDVQREIARELK